MLAPKSGRLAMKAGLSDLPDVQTRPLDWIRETDLRAKRRNDPSLPLDPDRYRGQPDSHFQSNPDILQEVGLARRIACFNHHQLSCALEIVLAEGFESTWITLGAEEQTKHFINIKMDIPELCLDELLGPSRDGMGFVRLLGLFLLANNQEPPKQPFIVQNDRFDALIGWKPHDPILNRKVFMEYRRMERTRYIAVFLGMVISSWQGHDPVIESLAHEHTETRSKLESLKGEACLKKWVERQKEMKLFCDACFKTEDKTKNGKMSVCAPCKVVGRDVRYCDRACQKDAWKAHKRSCAKSLEAGSMFEDILFHETYTRPDIPPATPDHRRSADLMRQIRLLNDNTVVDYFIVDAVPGHSAGIILNYVDSAATFIVIRGYAMSNVGPLAEAALFCIYRVLQTTSDTYDEEALRNQLRKEYGATFDNVLAALERGHPQPFEREVSREDVDKAIGHLKTLGRFKEQLKNYVSGAGETIRFTVRAGPNEEVRFIVNYPVAAVYNTDPS
ncbi:hypothetical protein FB45DRAFT_1063069 [Roridomyces roridus]|uniref:MYND-type domain-containing protein n=1 Tax=Roridomyces roridus TaxID=1738132 RepID=A0AAD7BEF0_9AGAR|nr:hypothetical protein FB45DRAFT_1063069 [Roridomyces roridus]